MHDLYLVSCLKDSGFPLRAPYYFLIDFNRDLFSLEV
jgi:hypothetical protein